MGSALPSGATGVTQEYFDVKNEELLVLPVSIYLIGYIVGSFDPIKHDETHCANV